MEAPDGLIHNEDARTTRWPRTATVLGRTPTPAEVDATLLALLGIDHEWLTYRYAGRDFRLTDMAGTVARDIFA